LNDDVPINERFFLGGSSFSGFERSGVGPRDRVTKDALGGNLFYVGTAELSFPIGFSEALGLRARIFSEVGSLWSIDDSNASVLDSESPRVSAGFGVSWGATLGGIRIDFSEAIVKEDEDETEFLRFSLGTRF
jgi:outer membrane protein insertion porin family